MKPAAKIIIRFLITYWRTGKCDFVYFTEICEVLNSYLRNLDDGTHILHPARFALLDAADQATSTKTFIPAHALIIQ